MLVRLRATSVARERMMTLHHVMELAVTGVVCVGKLVGTLRRRDQRDSEPTPRAVA